MSISQRTPEVEDRAVPGHWEGDLITGTLNKSAIGTLVERATGYVMLMHLPHAHGALEVQESMTTAMANLPPALRRTLTWDQGQEMANHVQIAAATELDIYFCDPHSPWQRGSNETARMRTLTGYCVNTSRSSPTYRHMALTVWRPPPTSSTDVPANDWAGEPQQKRSTDYYRHHLRIHQVLR